VAYLVSKYPAPSHTFIRREVDALRRRGLVIETFSLRPPTPDERESDDDRREFASTWYVRPVRWRRLLAAHVLALRAEPGRYVRTLREALRHRLPGVQAFRSAWLSFAEAILLAIELRGRGHVHLHNHFANDGGTLGYLATRYLGVPWSLTLHGTSEFDALSVLLLPDKIRAATFVACVSHFGRAQAMRAVDPGQWPKLCVVRCGIETRRLPERSMPTNRPVLRIVSVARLSAEKGHVGLIEAFAKAIERGARAELRLVGGGREQGRIQQEILGRGLGSRCSLLGRLPEPAVLREIADGDILVVSSFMEGLPVVLMEAMGLGVPVIAPCVAGIPELVEHGRTGLLFSPGNWDELAGHMLALLEDRDLRDRLAKAGRLRVADAFDVALAVAPLHERFARSATTSSHSTCS
jgi:glycosyltransferase involved in cell wall biosynthesis